MARAETVVASRHAYRVRVIRGDRTTLEELFRDPAKAEALYERVPRQPGTLKLLEWRPAGELRFIPQQSLDLRNEVQEPAGLAPDVVLSPVERAVVATVRMMGGTASFWVKGPRRQVAERLVERGLLERLRGSDHLPTRTAHPFDRYGFSRLGERVARTLGAS